MSLNEGKPVNISAAKEVLERAEHGESNRDEVNDTIKTLQDLQNQGVRDEAINNTLARLIEIARFTLTEKEAGELKSRWDELKQ